MQIKHFLKLLIILWIKILQIKTNGMEIPRHHRDDQILNQMLSIERYDSRLRPEAHTVVNVSVTLLTLSTPDESSLTYEIEFLLHLNWNDFRLKYEDRGKHKYLNALKHSDKLWIPDLYFIKHGKMSHKNINDIIALKIFNNGDIHYTNRYDMSVICSGDLKIFPLDFVKCNFAIESKFITHERHQLELLWSGLEPITSSDSISSTNAYLAKSLTNVCSKSQSWRQDYSCLNAVLLFTRDKSYYISVYFIPTLILVSITFLTFWLTTERLAVSRTIFNLSSLLGLIILFVSFRTHLPIVSNLIAINLWEFASIFFVCLANIEFVIQINKNKKSIESESRQRVVQEIEIRDQQSIGIQQICEQHKHNSPIEPKFRTNTILNRENYLDDISKYVFPISYYIFVSIYFIIFCFISNQNNY